MGTISNNFSYFEFSKSPKAEENGIYNSIPNSTVEKSVKALVENVLQPLRDLWKKPMPVNSGYRSEALNKFVNGQPTSQHRKGEAADIGCDDPFALAKCAKEAGLPYDQMILYPNFVHFSHKLNGPQRNQICYNRRYKGERL